MQRKSHASVFLSTCVLGLVLMGAAWASDVPLAANLDGGLIILDTANVSNVGGVSAAFNSTDNEFRVAWYDSRIAGQNDVYAQRLSANGSLLGGNEPIVTGTNSSTETSIAFNPVTYQYLITWKNQSGGPGSAGFNHTYGGVASVAGGLVTSITDYSSGGLEATLVYNTVDNEYFLEARNFAGGGSAGIYARRVSSAGAAVGGNLIITTTGAPAPAGQVIYNPTANQYLATWRNQSSSNLQGRLINGNGTFVGPAFIISTMFPESGLASSVAYDPVNDHYLVVFSEFCCGGVYAQFVDSLGTLVGSAIPLVSNVPADRLSPFVAYDPVNEAYLLAWSNSNTGEVKAQLLGDDGNPTGDILDLDNPGSAIGPPRVVANTTAGGFLVTFGDHKYTAPESHDILGQLISVEAMSLACDTETISQATGGTANFSLYGGAANATRNYFILGSISGTDPGLPLVGGAVLPLNWDAFTDIVIGMANSLALMNFKGVLDGVGEGNATLDTLGPLPAGTVGVKMYFAYLCYFEPDFASNAVTIEVVR